MAAAATTVAATVGADDGDGGGGGDATRQLWASLVNVSALRAAWWREQTAARPPSPPHTPPSPSVPRIMYDRWDSPRFDSWHVRSSSRRYRYRAAKLFAGGPLVTRMQSAAGVLIIVFVLATLVRVGCTGLSWEQLAALRLHRQANRRAGAATRVVAVAHAPSGAGAAAQGTAAVGEAALEAAQEAGEQEAWARRGRGAGRGRAGQAQPLREADSAAEAHAGVELREL